MVETKVNKVFVPKFFGVGVSKAKIASVEKTVAKTGSVKFTFNLEGESIEGFEGHEGKNCTIGWVNTFYMAKDESVQNTLKLIATIAEACGNKSDFSAEDLYDVNGNVIVDLKNVSTNEVDQILKLANTYCTGKFMYVNLRSEEYVNNNTGKIGKNFYFNYDSVFALNEIAEIKESSEYKSEDKTQTLIFTDPNKKMWVIDKKDPKISKKVATPDNSATGLPTGTANDPIFFKESTTGDLPF